MVMIGTSRRSRVTRTLLVVLQVFLLLFSAIGPVATYASDPPPSADPSPAPSEEPTPAPTPEPTAEPTAEPTPAAEPTPDPTPEPAPDPVRDPIASPDPLPDPSPEPTPAPTIPFIVAFAAGVTSAEQVAALDAAGATSNDTIAALRMHAVSASAAAVAALRDDARVSSVEFDRSRAAEADPNDSLYPDQWALPKIGWDQVFGTSIAGSATVAILDTGVDGSQPELAGKLVAGTSLLGTSATTDPNGHGTAMAGIVAASTNNGSGIAGVGYDGVRIMPVTVLGSDGTGRDSDVIEGLVWAADHGADVALMAFSASGYSSALQTAIDYSWSKGVVLVAATGNDGSSSAAFPAGDRGVVGVSNTDQSDTLNASSNYGADTFLAAPGTDILTVVPGGGTTSVTGTSASAAHVAAAAALLRAADGSLTNGVIVGRLARTADAAGTVAQTGNGRLNLARAFSDTSTGSIQPEGAAPVGDGGPFVGPYVAAARQLLLTFAGTGTGTVKITPNTGTVNAPVACGGTGNNDASQTVSSTCLPNISTSDNGATVTFLATAAGGSTFAGWSLPLSFSSSTCSGTTNPCSAVLGSNPSMTVTFNAVVNVAPTAANKTHTTNEDTPVAITLTATDPNECELTFSIVTPPANGSLSAITDNLCVSGSPNSDSASVTYTPSANFNGSDNFTYRANDGTVDSAPATVSITVNAVNDAPVNTVPGAQTTPEDATKTFSSANLNQISVNDVDMVGSNVIQVTLGVTNGTLSLGSTTGLTFSTGDGTADSTMTFTGSLTNVNAALNGLSYAPALNFNGSATLTITSNDQGNFGLGGALQDTDTVAITVTAVNDAPVITDVSASPSIISEGQSTTVTVTFTDVEADAHSCNFIWGDDTPDTTVAAGATSCSASHTYADDNPTATPTDTYTVAVTVTDDGTTNGAPDPKSDSDSTSVTVNNVAPLVTITGVDSTNEATGRTFGFSVFDPSTLDTFTFGTPSCGDSGTYVDLSFAFDATLRTGSFQCSFPDDSPTGTASDPSTLSLTATDDDTGVDTGTKLVTVNNVAPDNLTASASPATIDENGSTTVSGTFTDPGTQDTHTVVINWGTDEGSTTILLAAGVLTYSASHQYLDDNPTGTSSDTYAISVAVADDDLGTDTTSTSVTVYNVAPSALSLSATNVNENSSSILMGSFADPGTLDTHEVTIAWGDGSPNTILNLGAGVLTFTASHQYLDDNPTGTSSDPYTISVTVTDDDTGSTSGTKEITVSNVAPSAVIAGASPATINEDGSTTVSGSFTDPGTLDTHAVVLVWGDGTTNTTLNLAAGVLTYSASHTYLDDSPSGTVSDTYTVSVTVTDDDTGVGSGSVAVVVNNVAPSSVTASASTSTINENGSTTVSGAFADPGTLDIHTVTINWGDGSPSTVQTLTVGARAYSASHQYLDDNPTGTASDNYSIGVTVTDDDLGQATGSTSVTVNNVAPTITSFIGTTSFSGPLVFVPSTFTTTFTDPGTQDTFRAEFNWGDGSPVQTVAPFTSGQKVDHIYTTAICGGVVTVKVIDDDTGNVTATTTVNVGTGGFLAPMTNQPVTNKLKNGQVLPVKINLTDCNGIGVTGLTPAIRLVAGDLTTVVDDGTVTITPPSVSGADTNGWMRASNPNGTYIYNMQVNIPLSTDYTVVIYPLAVQGTDPVVLNTGYTLRHVIQATK